MFSSYTTTHTLNAFSGLANPPISNYVSSTQFAGSQSKRREEQSRSLNFKLKRKPMQIKIFKNFKNPYSLLDSCQSQSQIPLISNHQNVQALQIQTSIAKSRQIAINTWDHYISLRILTYTQNHSPNLTEIIATIVIASSRLTCLLLQRFLPLKCAHSQDNLFLDPLLPPLLFLDFPCSRTS